VEYNSIFIIDYLSHHCLSEIMDPMEYLDHGSITLQFDIPLFISRAIFFNNAWSLYELDEDIYPRFYIPTEYQLSDSEQLKYIWDPTSLNQGHIRESIYAYCEDGYKLYTEMLKNDIDINIARIILPENIYIRFKGSISLRTLRDYLQRPSQKIHEKKIKEIILQICRYRIPNWRAYESL